MKISTRKQAIDEYWRDCIYDSLAGGSWLAQVEACVMTKCALYSFRPVTSATRKIRQDEKIANMSETELIAFNKKRDAMSERVKKMHNENVDI